MWCFCSKIQTTHFGSKNWMDGWMIKGWKKILALKSVEIILHQPPNLNVLSIFFLEKGRPLFRHLQLKISSVSKLCTETFFFWINYTCVFFSATSHSDPIRSEISRRCGWFFFRKGQTWPAQWLPRAFGDVFLLGGFLDAKSLVILLMLQKSGGCTSWYGKYPQYL